MTIEAEIPNPFLTQDDDWVYEAQLSLALACGRSKSVLKNKHREYFCFLQQVLRDESDRRGSRHPSPPYRA